MQDDNTEKTEILQAFAWRLATCADRAGLKQTQIAERLGIGESTVGGWFQGLNFPRKAQRPKLAQMLGVTWNFLETGNTEKPDPIGIDLPSALEVRQIPVVSWSHAGSAATYEEIPKTWQVRVSTFLSDKRAFAVEVEGDCMEPKFMEGDRVVLSPSNEPRNGKPVVAKLADDGVQLRIYHKLQSGRIRLATLKPEIYPTEEYDASAFHWIYPVLEMSRAI